MRLFFVSLLFIYQSLALYAYESEDKLKTVIVGKVAKYILWKEQTLDSFVITVLNNEFFTLFDEVYKDRTIKNRAVEIKYITDIDDLEDTDILFISQKNLHDIDDILDKVEKTNILTISDLRGFAQKRGCIQLYFLGRKLKLKLNIDIMKAKQFKVDKRLIRVSEIVKGDEDVK